MGKNAIVNKKDIIIAVMTVVLVVTVIFSGLGPNLMTVQAADYTFDSLTAIAYADFWWDGRNPAYHDYGTVDCANFVSQVLIAGGLNLNVPPYADSWGCIPSCDNLNTYLVGLGTTNIVSLPGGEVPDWFGPGDVVLFGDTIDPWRHSAFAVAQDSSGNILVDAHSNNRYHVPVSFYFSATSTFTLCTYYDVNTTASSNLISTTLVLNGTKAAKGKPAQTTATLSGGSTLLTGKTINVYVQQKVKGGVTWVLATSSQTVQGIANITIPAKYITLQPQPIKAVFTGDSTYSGSVGTAQITR